MKTIVYWTTTGLVAAGMAASSFMYLTANPMLTGGFQAAGLPLYLLPLLGIAKFLGAIALVVPTFPKIKEWAYAGFAFTFLGAAWVHISTGTPWLPPVVFLALLGVSYATALHRLKTQVA